MTCPRCRLARDLRPEPWYGDHWYYDVLAVLFPALFLVGMALI
jgi:hypothetical protein